MSYFYWRMLACANRRSIALHRADSSCLQAGHAGCSSSMRGKVRLPQILLRQPYVEISPQQPLQRIWNLLRRCPVPQWAGCTCIPPHRPTHTKNRTHPPAAHSLLDLLALNPDISDPVLSAAIRAARHMRSLIC